MKQLISNIIITLTALFSVGVVHAAAPVELSSDVFVEKTMQRSDGSFATILEKPNLVTPGDNLVFVVKYKNVGAKPAEKFVVTNPLPSAVVYNGTSDGREIVSVDGGNSWGYLSSLRVSKEEGKSRPALMSDVTHIRWNLNQPIAVGSGGKLIFRGIVR